MVLIAAMAWSILCLSVLFRKQWVEHERFEYPLMAVGIRMTELETYARARGFRIGLVLGFVAVAWNVLTCFSDSPEIPTVPTSGKWQRWIPDAPTFWGQISIYILGFAYFARVEALLSFWLFFVLAGIEVSVFDRLGVGVRVGQGGVEAVRSQSFGALFGLSCVSFYTARGHLTQVIWKAAGRGDEVSDAEEVVSYRTAIFGLPTGVVVMFGWLSAAGMEPQVLGLYLVFAFTAYLGLSRVIAESRTAVCEYLRHRAELDTVVYPGCPVGLGLIPGWARFYIFAFCDDTRIPRATLDSDAEAHHRPRV